MRLAFDFGEFTIQRFTVDTKGVGGLIFVAAGLFEDLEDVFFLHFIQRQGPFSRVVEHAPIATGPLNRSTGDRQERSFRFG